RCRMYRRLLRYAERAAQQDAHRRPTRSKTDRELWIVGEDRTDSDEHGVVRGAQLVREAQRALAAHPPRVAGARRDAAIDRLCVMHRHERTVFWDRGRVDATRIRQPGEEVAHARG